MSTNLHIARVCEHCKKMFTARTTVTRFCSHKCNQRAYKFQQKKEKVQQSNLESSQIILAQQTKETKSTHQRETITIKELILILGVSERTLYRLMKTEGFPKLKVRRRVLFNKQAVIDFITTKYKADAGNIEKEEIEERGL